MQVAYYNVPVPIEIEHIRSFIELCIELFSYKVLLVSAGRVIAEYQTGNITFLNTLAVNTSTIMLTHKQTANLLFDLYVTCKKIKELEVN